MILLIRDPFFDAMTRDEEDDDEDEDVFHHDAFMGGQQDPFDGAFRFGFSFGPDGMRVQEPPVFGHILREMEEIFSQMGRLESGHFGQSELLTNLVLVLVLVSHAPSLCCRSPQGHASPSSSGQRRESSAGLHAQTPGPGPAPRVPSAPARALSRLDPLLQSK